MEKQEAQLVLLPVCEMRSNEVDLSIVVLYLVSRGSEDDVPLLLW